MLKYKVSILITLLLIGCSLTPESQKKKEIKEIVKKWYGKQISFPDSIFVLKNKAIYPVQTNPLNSENLKILTLVSGECISCIETLNKWNLFIDSVKNISEIKLVVIIMTPDVDQFINNFYSLIPEGMTLYIDAEFNFLKSYKMPDDFMLRTFLLDKSNKVLLIGNPVYRNEIKKLYLNEIKEN
jgi:hypothetical protein